MPRRPTGPRYYPSRRAYYVQVGGRQILLAKGDRDDPQVERRAKERFREVVPARPSKVVAITDEEIATVFQHERSSVAFVLFVLYYTGCQPKEVIGLTADDLDREKLTLKIGARVVPCKDEFFTWLTELVDVVPKGQFLRNRKGQPWTVDALHGAWTRLRDRLGLRKELTPFSWRHAFALRFLEKGRSITDLAAILGISETQATRLYGQ